jgi:hypothetical protein
MMAGGAIDFDELTLPEVFDPRRVEGEDSRALPPEFLECSA